MVSPPASRSPPRGPSSCARLCWSRAIHLANRKRSMRSFTDTFIKHPVLAAVVNLVIVLVGWRALTTLPVQQYPKIESSSVLITTVYYGAGAETVRGFLTTPIERAVSAISGVDYVESTSRAGVSSITVHLKLNHNSTAALAEVSARLQQVRSELPAEAEPPVVEVQRADRPYASFYLSFTSSERNIPQLTDWLTRNMQPQLSTLAGVQRVDVVGGRPIAMRIWIDPDRLAALNLAPGDVHAALQRNNYLAAVGQTKGELVQVNLLANTDLRTPEEFKNLVVAERNGAIVRLSDVARVELGAEEADYITKFSDKEAVYLGVWPVPGSNEIEVASRLHAEMARIRTTLPSDIDMQMAYDATVFMTDALHEISKTLVETILIVGLVVFLFMGSIRTALVPLVAMPVSLVGAAIVVYAFGFSLHLLTILAIVLAAGLVVDDAIVVVENVERHVREGKTRIQAAIVGARELVGPIIAMTITLAAVYTPIGFQGGLTGSLFLEIAAGAGAHRGPEPHQPVHGGLARRVARGDQQGVAPGGEGRHVVPRSQVHVVADGQLGRVRRDGREELEGTQTHDRADVRPGVLRGVAGAGLAGVPPPRPPVADARAV